MMHARTKKKKVQIAIAVMLVIDDKFSSIALKLLPWVQNHNYCFESLI